MREVVFFRNLAFEALNKLLLHESFQINFRIKILASLTSNEYDLLEIPVVNEIIIILQWTQ
jgi:hypothetical protein